MIQKIIKRCLDIIKQYQAIRIQRRIHFFTNDTRTIETSKAISFHIKSTIGFASNHNQLFIITFVSQ